MEKNRTPTPPADTYDALPLLHTHTHTHTPVPPASLSHFFSFRSSQRRRKEERMRGVCVCVGGVWGRVRAKYMETKVGIKRKKREKAGRWISPPNVNGRRGSGVRVMRVRVSEGGAGLDPCEIKKMGWDEARLEARLLSSGVIGGLPRRTARRVGCGAWVRGQRRISEGKKKSSETRETRVDGGWLGRGKGGGVVVVGEREHSSNTSTCVAAFVCFLFCSLTAKGGGEVVW